jgi:2-iminobutanoate/2-iminopropanoate deaminase
MRESISTKNAPPPAGPWSQAIRAVGPFLFLSGQGPFDVDGNRVGTTVAEQTRRTLENLASVAEAAGGSLQDAVRVGIYLRDLETWHEMNSEYARFFQEPFPARTTIQSDLSGFDVEIDAIVPLSAD